MKDASFKPEILAPVGSPDAFYAAVNSGADAVYLGVNDFNARAKCENFTLDNIGGVIDHAHLFGVKVYITLNTLISDNEVSGFLRAFDVLYNAKADAFIMQDIGMAMLVKKLYPAAVLNASTQMGIHNADGAIFAQKWGYKRVILSRETKLEDIILIKERTDLEIEFFAQGALCVAFSGNCYLSSVKDGNSGNRGRCHQLCRLKYACGKKQGYLLSPNDLCLAGEVETLKNSGVVSFKIEGRMKRPSYVAAATRAYRLAVDDADDKQISAAVDVLSKTFSRGAYNKTAYLYDNDDIIDTVNNNNTGTYIGKVTDVRPFKDLYKITVETDAEIAVGDGLRFVGKNDLSIGVGTAEKTEKSAYMLVTARKGISVGDKVYKTFDKVLEDKLTAERKLLPVNCHVKAYVGEPLEMTLTCGDTSVTACGEVCERAKTNALDKSAVAAQIKFGDLPFTLTDVALDTDGVFVAKSVFNALRRDATEKLRQAVIKANSPDLPEVHPSDEQIKAAVGEFTSHIDGFINNDNYVIIKSLDELSNARDSAVIYSPDNYNNHEKSTIIDLSRGFYLNLPIIATQKDVAVVDKLVARLDGLFGKKVGVVANNYYGLKYLGDRPVVVGAGLNVYNRISAGFYLSLGVKDIILNGEIKGFSPFAVYTANMPLMTFAHCPYKVSAGSKCSECTAKAPLIYTDERGNKYKITRYRLANCYFELRLYDENEYLKLVPKDKSLRKVLPF